MMGKTAVPYKKNNISFDKAAKYYKLYPIEASKAEYFEGLKLPFSEVSEILEYDSGEVQFFFGDGSWFIVKKGGAS